MKKVLQKTVRPVNVVAKVLTQGQFRHQVVMDKKNSYSRKGRNSSMRKFEALLSSRVTLQQCKNS